MRDISDVIKELAPEARRLNKNPKDIISIFVQAWELYRTINGNQRYNRTDHFNEMRKQFKYTYSVVCDWLYFDEKPEHNLYK